MAISTMSMWDLRMSMLWMDAEMYDWENKANGVLVLEPLVKGEMEEWLAPGPPFTACEDCTDEREWILVDGEESTPPLTTTPRISSRFVTANVCCIARALSISRCERFFDAIHSLLLAYNARYQSSYSLGIEEEQMAISPKLNFQHMTNHPWLIPRWEHFTTPFAKPVLLSNLTVVTFFDEETMKNTCQG
jgi:hypothetical protein